ncbi:MAG: beta tubulin [Rickettsiales bacterium]|nr:MAG: beta tubulin [Rickettsiales bacterium]
MRQLTQELTAHLSAEVTTLASCWRIERTDGLVLGFTDHDRPLMIDGVKYDSIAGFTPTNVESGSDMAVDNLDLAGQTFPSKITEIDLLAGKYDFAKLEVFLVNYNKPNTGKLIQKRGLLGEVTIKKQLFYAEVRGLTQFLSQTMCESYSPHCRATLGDARCKFNLDQGEYTVRAAITEIINNQTFRASILNHENEWFKDGYLIWESGNNIATKMEVKEFANHMVTLALPMPFAMHESDEFSIIAGCNKSSNCCKQKFNNIINFRGEPDLPGIDKLMRTAGTALK